MTLTSTSLLPLYYTLIPAALSNLIHFYHLKRASPNPKIDFNYNLFLKRILMTRGKKQFFVFLNSSLTNSRLSSLSSEAHLFFQFNPPSSTPSFLIPIPPLSSCSGPLSRAHRSSFVFTSRSSPSSEFTLFPFLCLLLLLSFSSFFFIIFSLADGLSNTFPVRYVCLPQTPHPPFLPLTS